MFGKVLIQDGMLDTKKVSVKLEPIEINFSGPWNQPRLLLKGTSRVEKTNINISLKGTIDNPELSLRIIFLAILPNCLGPLIVQTTLSFASAILDAAALSFLGLGAQPPTPEWGAMIAQSRALILRASWVMTLPGITILLAVLGFNLLGDGLRDALDPRLRD